MKTSTKTSIETAIETAIETGRLPFDAVMIGFLAVGVAPCPSLSAFGQPISDAVTREVRAAALGSGSSVSVAISAIETDTLLAAFEPDRAMVPASNQKLLTSVAAFRELGPDFVFRTHFVLSEDGTLTVVGSGDPALGDPEILSLASPPTTLEQVLDDIAAAVAEAGTERIEAVVIDDRVFDRNLVHPSWPADQHDRHYSAPVAGVNIHRNVVSLTPRPSPAGPGNRAEVKVSPNTSWVTVDVQAKTVGEGRNVFRAERDESGRRFRVLGKIREPSTISADVTMRDPATFFGGLIADALERRGIEVGEAGRNVLEDVRLASNDDPSPSGDAVAWIDTPLPFIARRCNVDSANLYAEAMLKRVGAGAGRGQGSWPAGASAIRAQIAEHLSPRDATRTIVADGSGLSRDNRVSPGTLVRWLDAAYEDETIRDALIESLPEPGEGTLRNRFTEQRPANRLYAKTGTIRGVSTLSGYLVHEGSGLAVAFSIMTNDLSGPSATRNARRLQERLVLLADQELSRMAQASAEIGTIDYGG
ncbi:MAG: D-alanyl-D-alanine carboxypeptidase/D-alanyl-D-alanine-endopeptidase [Planctomycetota bacterium]